MKKPIKLFVIMDKSGSMNGVRQETVTGIQEYLQSLKKDKNQYEVTLTLFDTVVEKIRDAENLDTMAELKDSEYRPEGMTALLDAVGLTIEGAMKTVKKTDKCLVVIMTDGMENSSKEYTGKTIAKLVKELEAKGNWTFTFMGANQDSWHTAQNMGFGNKGNTMNYTPSGAGTRVAFDTLARSTGFYAQSASMSVDNFYEDNKDA